MSKVLYFSDSVQLVPGNLTLDNAKFKARFPGVKGIRSDGFEMRVGRDEAGNLLPITRVIFRKPSPSNHKCGARCRHATGNQCECECGGRFHGAGG